MIYLNLRTDTSLPVTHTSWTSSPGSHERLGPSSPNSSNPLLLKTLPPRDKKVSSRIDTGHPESLENIENEVCTWFFLTGLWRDSRTLHERHDQPSLPECSENNSSMVLTKSHKVSKPVWEDYITGTTLHDSVFSTETLN